MTLLDTSIECLRARVAYLQADFALWRLRTGPKTALRQHCSQVQRITNTLSSTLAHTLQGTTLGQGDHVDTGAVPLELKDLPRLRRLVGSVHLLWEFFREKFAARDLEAFQHYLGVGDDFAWACYEPCLAAHVAARRLIPAAGAQNLLREPPLVSFTTDRTPFAQARSKMFHPAGLDSKDVEHFAHVLKGLPVPVVAIPWAAANRLPDLVLLGHEVGHVVAEDLGLAGEARAVLAQVTYPQDPDKTRQKSWKSWSDEVFADVFGVLATGRAFVAALACEFAAGVNDVRRTPINKESPGDYPTPTLRMSICEAVLRRLGISPECTWSEVYGELVGPSQEFAADVEVAVQALVDRPWTALGGKQLTEVLPWKKADEDNAKNVAKAALARTQAPGAFAVRTWVAAALHAAHGDAAEYARLSLDHRLALYIVARRGDGVRSERAKSLRAQVKAGDEAATETADRTAGINIAKLLESLPT